MCRHVISARKKPTKITHRVCVCFPRWGVCVVLCCVVLLVVVCYLLGLVLGPAGLSPRKDPAKRSCTADCGGVFLMM